MASHGPGLGPTPGPLGVSERIHVRGELQGLGLQAGQVGECLSGCVFLCAEHACL